MATISFRMNKAIIIAAIIIVVGIGIAYYFQMNHNEPSAETIKNEPSTETIKNEPKRFTVGLQESVGVSEP